MLSAMDCLVRFLPSERSIEVPSGTPLIEAARLAGLPVARSCGGDVTCGRCGLLLIDAPDSDSRPHPGPESRRETMAKARNTIDPALRLSCCLAVERNLTVTAPYW